MAASSSAVPVSGSESARMVTFSSRALRGSRQDVRGGAPHEGNRHSDVVYAIQGRVLQTLGSDRSLKTLGFLAHDRCRMPRGTAPVMCFFHASKFFVCG